MSIGRKWRGAAAGLFLSVAGLGTVAATSPSQAADIRFGVVLADYDHRPPMRFERMPVPPRHYERADWRPGYWAWRQHRWDWIRGRYERGPDRHDYRFDHRRDFDHGRYGRW